VIAKGMSDIIIQYCSSGEISMFSGRNKNR